MFGSILVQEMSPGYLRSHCTADFRPTLGGLPIFLHSAKLFLLLSMDESTTHNTTAVPSEQLELAMHAMRESKVIHDSANQFQHDTEKIWNFCLDRFFIAILHHQAYLMAFLCNKRYYCCEPFQYGWNNNCPDVSLLQLLCHLQAQNKPNSQTM